MLKNFSSIVGWKACCRISDKDVPSIVAELERFDFGSLDKTLMGFGEFLSWLYKLVLVKYHLIGACLLTLSRAIETTLSYDPPPSPMSLRRLNIFA